MKKHWLGLVAVALAWGGVLAVLLCAADVVVASPAQAPTVDEVAPSSAPNDLDTTVVITGSGFVAMPTVILGTTQLDDVGWVSAERLTATVPWGLITGTYTLTVANPGGESGSLVDAFTVTQGIGVFTTDGPYGGSIQDIYQEPGNPSKLFALAYGVGLFASENAGQSWELIYNQDGYCCEQGSLAFDAQDPDVIYAGTEPYRSTDGGETWDKLWIFPDIPGGWPCTLHFPAAHPSLGQVVYVGVGCTDHYPDPAPEEAGVFRSNDYGETWITKTNGLTDTNIWALAVHPIVTQTMLAGTYGGNLFVSLDGSDNWSLTGHINGAIYRIQFNPYKPLEAWVISCEYDDCYAYRSTDLSVWEPLDFDGSGDNRCAATNVSFLSDSIWVPAHGSLYVSTDGGNTWNALDNIHRGANAIEISASNPQEIYLATDSGMEKSVDGGANWQEINQGLAGQYPYLLATSPLDPELVFVKTQQGIYRSYNGGTIWQSLDYGRGGSPRGDYLAIDPYTSTRIYLGANTFCSDDQFCLEISADSGDTWEIVTASLPVDYTGWGGGISYAVAPHPLVQGRLLVGSSIFEPSNPDNSKGMIFASDDYGRSWAYMGPTQPISYVVGIAYDAVDPNLVYMITIGSGQWRSTDGGATWQQIANIGESGFHEEIVTHPTHSGHVVMSVDSDGAAAIWGSQDAGETWNLLNDNAGPPLRYAPTSPPILYVKKSSPEYSGLLRSFDDGQTWEQMPDAPYPNRLATATDGERVILYIGSPGGLASQADTQTGWQSNAVLGETTIFGGGVYRMTMAPLDNYQVYLPLVLKGHSP
jgi:photosystem II stability/assembly factor-like uncharacterized protein